jgi:hypothetical protein
MAEHAVALQCLDRGISCIAARKRLSDALGVPVSEPDEQGFVEVRLEAEDFEGALQQAWNGMAAAGADDHLVFAEHPDVPEHWRHRDGDGSRPSEAERI